MQTPEQPPTSELPRRPAEGQCVAEKYTLVRCIGSGGMGSVWEAQHLFTHAHVALKLLNPGIASDAQMISRFLREARAVTAIGHPNLVRVLDMGPSEFGFYLAQELLHGGTLFDALTARGSFDAAALWTLLRPIAEALDAAHRIGVIHRDIKPENIFLAEGADGSVTPRLIDFGIAKTVATGRDVTHVTAPNQTPGTPAYMAPEQYLGEVELDARADVWALGVVFHECLAGAHPFEGNTMAAVMMAILEGRAAPLVNVDRTIPPAVVAVVRAAMTVDRAQRIPTIRAFIDAMDAASAGAAHPGDASTSAPEPAPSPSPVRARGAGQHTSLEGVQRPPAHLVPATAGTAWFSASAGVIVLVALVAFVFVVRRTTTTSPPRSGLSPTALTIDAAPTRETIPLRPAVDVGAATDAGVPVDVERARASAPEPGARTTDSRRHPNRLPRVVSGPARDAALVIQDDYE